MKGYVAILLAVVVAASASLVAGAGYLEVRLPGGLPFGTLLVILGLGAAAGASLLLSRSGTVMRWLAVVSLVAVLAWFPVGYALAGNAALNFSDGADGTFFLRQFTVGVVLIVVGTLGAALAAAGFRAWRRRRAT